MAFAEDYVDVAHRIVEFRERFPEGSLQQQSLEFREVNGGWWVIYTAAAYRHPDDPRPGIGTAWEPVPGRTPFTRDSEVQNAETAAWGRAIVAALAADTKRGIASADEVRARHGNGKQQPAARPSPELDAAKRAVKEAWESNMGEPFNVDTVAAHFESWSKGGQLADASAEHLRDYVAALNTIGQQADAAFAGQQELPDGEAAS